MKISRSSAFVGPVSIHQKIRLELNQTVDTVIELLSRGDITRAKELLLELVEDEGITRVEAAKMLGVSVRTLEDWAAAGVGPAFYRISDGPRAGVRYARRDVRDYREQRKIRSGLYHPYENKS